MFTQGKRSQYLVHPYLRMGELYSIIHDRLRFAQCKRETLLSYLADHPEGSCLHPVSMYELVDIEALTQNVCVQLEKQMGIYPNTKGRTSPYETPDVLTIRASGPQGSGKTRVLRLISNVLDSQGVPTNYGSNEHEITLPEGYNPKFTLTGNVSADTKPDPHPYTPSEPIDFNTTVKLRSIDQHAIVAKWGTYYVALSEFDSEGPTYLVIVPDSTQETGSLIAGIGSTKEKAEKHAAAHAAKLGTTEDSVKQAYSEEQRNQHRLIDMLARDAERFKEAGCKLCAAALRVLSQRDGLHRMALEISAWGLALADEGNRDRYRQITPHSAPEDDGTPF